MATPSLPPGPPSPYPLEVEPRWEPALRQMPPPRPRSAWQRWGRNLLLFVLTVLSVFFVGAVHSIEVPSGEALALVPREGILLALGLLGILTAHEMGHYVAARRYGVDATLPFFIPFPLPLFSLVGTLGAFIRIRSPIPNRKALFDIGVAGPLAGFAVCLPVLWLGLHEAKLVAPGMVEPGIQLGEPLLFQWMTLLVRGPIPDSMTLTLGPLGLAAWFGLFVTALNLMPIGQLDGGHVTYALLGRHARRISMVSSWVTVALVYFGPNWIVWALVLRILGRRHPSTLDDQAAVGRGRYWVGLLSLAVFVACFTPNPIVTSWSDILASLGIARYLP